MASIQCVCAVLQNKTPALPSRELLPEIESRGQGGRGRKKCRLKIHDPKKSFSRTKTLPLEYPALEKA